MYIYIYPSIPRTIHHIPCKMARNEEFPIIFFTYFTTFTDFKGPHSQAATCPMETMKSRPWSWKTWPKPTSSDHRPTKTWIWWGDINVLSGKIPSEKSLLFLVKFKKKTPGINSMFKRKTTVTWWKILKPLHFLRPKAASKFLWTPAGLRSGPVTSRRPVGHAGPSGIFRGLKMWYP